MGPDPSDRRLREDDVTLPYLLPVATAAKAATARAREQQYDPHCCVADRATLFLLRPGSSLNLPTLSPMKRRDTPATIGPSSC